LETIGTAGLVVSTALNAWSLLFEPVAIIDLIADVAATIGGIGSSVLDAAFDTETYDLMLCIFFCDIGSDGQVSEGQFAQIQADMSALNETAQIVMALILGAQGSVGLANAGAIGSEAGDCADCECEWCYLFDADNQLEDWTAESYHGAVCTWDGVKWNSALADGDTQVIWISKTFDETTLTATDFIEYSPLNTNRAVFANGNGTAFSGTNIRQNAVPANLPITATRLDIYILQAHNGDLRSLTSFQVEGLGDNPFGADNC